jgi:hypothetical protein
LLLILAVGWYARPKRAISYYIQVQKYRDGTPVDAPFRLSGELLFPAGYRMRLVVSSPQKGHLYLVNEAPVSPSQTYLKF